MLKRIQKMCFIAAALMLVGCASDKAIETERPSVSPAAQTGGEGITLDGSGMKPMYTQLMAIDLPTVVQVVEAKNLDIQQARQRVVEAVGQVDARVGAIFPVLAPTAIFEHADGFARAAGGDLVQASFNSFQPVMVVQWVVNPGRVIYDIVAAKKRLNASKQDEQSVKMESLRAAASQYYELILTQAEVAAAREAVVESEELVRISSARSKAGAGVLADELRAQSSLAGRRQDLALALSRFYQASVALSLTLHLESTVTLVPSVARLAPTTLVDENRKIDELIDLAIQYRPDLQKVKAYVEAAHAETKSTWWGGLGPTGQASYLGGGIQSKTPAQDLGMKDQQRFSAAASWNFGVSTFGNIKSADAREQQAIIDADKKLDQVRGQLVQAMQLSITQKQLIPLAEEQVRSAEESLRLTQKSLQSGTVTTLDVLDAQSSAAAARVRSAQAVVRYNQAQIDLLASLGLIESKSLMTPQ